jgi:predicted phosphoribosyltransferase
VLAAEIAVRLRPSSPVVLALPRGGVPVAAEVATALSAPLGVILVRKLGVPSHRELAMGALAMIGADVSLFRNADVIRDLGISDSAFEAVRAGEQAELQRRRTALGGEAPTVTNAEVIVVDDGLATGSTMMAAVAALRPKAPAKIIVAIPVASRSAVRSVGAVADLVVCPAMPEPFFAVGAAYKDFGQLTDDQVMAILQRY